MAESSSNQINGHMMEQIALEQNQQEPLEDLKAVNVVLDKKQFSNAEFKDQCLAYQQQYVICQEQFQSSPNLEFYLLSIKWLEQWGKFAGFQDTINGKEPKNPEFSNRENHPGDFNIDLQVDAAFNQSYRPPGQSWQLSNYNYNNISEDPSKGKDFYFTTDICNGVFLNDSLQEGEHFIFVNRQIMQMFCKNYSGFVIKRMAYVQNGQKRVEVYPLKIKVIPMYNDFLKKLKFQQTEKTNEFQQYWFQISRKASVQQMKDQLFPAVKEVVKNPYPNSWDKGLQIENMRVWQLSAETTIQDLFIQVQKCVKDSTSAFDYKMPFEGKYLERSLDLKVEDLFLLETSVLVVETKQEYGGFILTQEGVMGVEICEGCRKYKLLTIECKCKTAKYCTQQCKNTDIKYHMKLCEFAIESEDENASYAIQPGFSIAGACGLENLGNTCFMNSAIQCLIHTESVVRYFCEQPYKKQINVTNPLGSKGRLAKQFGSLIRHTYVESDRIFSPYGIKAAVANLNPIFAGYAQHDSAEFLSYLVDGLHEDLNRVIVKQPTTHPKSHNRRYADIAAESWANHLKRNQSIIVDNMHGLFKSKVVCPTCERASLTFDPFATCTLPIPLKSEKLIEFYYLHQDNYRLPWAMKIKYNPNKSRMSDIKKQIAECAKVDPASIDMCFMSHQAAKFDFTDDTMTEDVNISAKTQTLYALEMRKEMYEIAKQEKSKSNLARISVSMVQKLTGWLGSYSSRKNFTSTRPMWFHIQTTLSQLHLIMFEYYQFMFEPYYKAYPDRFVNAVTLQEKYQTVFHYEDTENFEQFKPPYVLCWESNATYWIDCAFCGEKSCKNCEIGYSDVVTIGQMLEKVKQAKINYFELQIEVFWNNPGSIFALTDMNHLETYEKWKMKQSLNESQQSSTTDQPLLKKVDSKNKTGGAPTKEKIINLYNCLDQFQMEEKMDEHNTVYCKFCKEHKQSTKQMVIHQAPSVLIIHLKRFKQHQQTSSSYGYGYGMSGYNISSKIDTLIDFPIEGLDMAKYVIDHRLPMDCVQQNENGIIQEGEFVQASSASSVQQLQQQQQSEMQTEEVNHQTIQPKDEANPQNHEQEQQQQCKMEQSDDDDVNKDQIDQQELIKGIVTQDHLYYDLFAISNHSGNVGGGHYTAYAQCYDTRKWYCFNDSFVSPVTDLNFMVSREAYLLFYKRRDKGWISAMEANQQEKTTF